MASGAAYQHNLSGLCERAIQTLLSLLSCPLAGEEHHSTCHARLPELLWMLNTSVCAGTGFSPFDLEHGREPWRSTRLCCQWVPNLGLRPCRHATARQLAAAVDRGYLPREARRKPPPLEPATMPTTMWNAIRATRLMGPSLFQPGPNPISSEAACLSTATSNRSDRAARP